MPVLPTGTVTFLFADIEGSTHLVQHLGDRGFAALLQEYQRLLREAVQVHNGSEVDTEGDGYFAAFPRARDAVEATIAMQRAFGTHAWPAGVAVRVRIGMHTGEPIATDTGYVGVDVHRAARISAAASGGQSLISHSTEALVRQSLPLGASLLDLGEHRLKDLQEAEHLFQIVHPDLLQGFAPLRTLSALPNNLPLQLTSFVGREGEIVEVERLLSTQRLITLTGIGGVGKTRLAMQVAAEVLERFSDGVWLVALDALSDETLLPQAVATALGIREEPGRTLRETVLAALRSRTLLLVLDNCEHLIDGCAHLAHRVLEDSPGVRILATSREPLRVPGETIRPIPPLSLPDHEGLPIEKLDQSEAVRLFVERAVLVRPQFALAQENAAAVARIVGQLAGVPLAIELAAARLKALSVEEVSGRLSDALRLLTGGARTLLPRHQTLQAAIDWSHDLLSDDERTVLRRVGGCRGSFSLEAAVALCGAGFEALAVADVLGSLVEKSLLLIDVRGETSRYRMLDIMRQYTRVKAEAAGEWEAVLDRHLAFFLAMARKAASQMRGAQEQRWLEQLDLDHDNISAALERAHLPEQPGRLLEFASSLERFWLVRGYWSEGRQWLELGLARDGTVTVSLRARALAALANLAYSQADFDRASEFGRQALAAYRALADHQGIAKSLGTLGSIAYQRGDFGAASTHHGRSLEEARGAGARYETAVALLNLAIVADHQGEFPRATALSRESLQLFREEHEARGTAGALHLLGVLAGDQGDHVHAEEYFRESLAISREIGDKRGIAAGLNSLAQASEAHGDFTTARELYGQSLSIRRGLGHAWGVADTLTNLGVLASRSGDLPGAIALFQESLKLRLSLGDKGGIARCLEGLARVAPAPIVAARLLGAASKLREDLGYPVPPSIAVDQDRYLDTLRTAIDGAFPQVWNEARALTLDEAVGEALNITSGPLSES
jgi:predicted ATPase/class 3 adenylate cyclase/Tfp pilus assembly protein PilF